MPCTGFPWTTAPWSAIRRWPGCTWWSGGSGATRARTLLEKCSAGIPETYKADVSTADAVDDLTTMLELRESGTEFAVRLVEDPDRWTLVVYRPRTPITLSEA